MLFRSSKSDPQAVYLIAAQLTDASGRGLGGQRVDLTMVTSLLGKDRAVIASVMTDGGGVAKTAFVATKEGPFQFAAKFVGNDQFAASEATPQATEIRLLDETKALPPTPQVRLATLGRWVPWLGLALGVGVWITLVYVMASVLIVVPGAARRGANR